jgi:hypothetical protein
MEFQCRGTGDGKLEFGPYNRARFKQFLIENPGIRLKVVAQLPESRKMRGFLEGGIIPLIAYYQEGMDHRNEDDRAKVREWLKEEHHGELVDIGGVVHKIGKSTKGREALTAFLERVMDWLIENYQPPQEAITPENYKHWRDTIFPIGGPDNYIGYLVETGILKPYGKAI